MDTSTFDKFLKTVNKGELMSREEFTHFLDSSRKVKGVIFGKGFQDKQQYDSLRKAGKVTDGWLTQKIRNKIFEINDKYRNHSEKLVTNLLTILAHNFPQMLFISLPLFALFLKLIYFRHRDFYFVSHGIYTVHLYIFYFIALLAIMVFSKLFEYFEWTGFSGIATVMIIFLLFYEYKAMRNFYGQRRGKTFLKFMLAASWRLFVIIILLILFSIFSLLKV
jgi:hypothetical protein